MIQRTFPNRYRNAGMLGLAHEIRAMSTAELREQRELLSGVHPAPLQLARPRLALVLDELSRRDDRQPLRLVTPAELITGYGL